VMSQIEQLICGLLASQDLQCVDRRFSNPVQIRRPSRKASITNSAEIPHVVPELGCLPDPPTQTLKPQNSGVSKQASLPPNSTLSVSKVLSNSPSRQVTPSDDGSTDGMEGLYRLHHGWEKRVREQESYRLQKTLNSRTHSTNLVPSTPQSHSKGWCPPDLKFLWSVAAGSLILFDCISIPLLGFTVREPWIFDLIRIVFWTSSLPLLWRNHGGCSSYAVADLAVEVFLVILIFCALIQGSSLSTEAQFFLRGPELIRMRHIRRLHGLRMFPRFLVRWNRGELRRLEMRAAANICITLLLCAVGVHVLTCTWFAAGSSPNGWAVDAGLLEQPFTEQYRMTLEFALSRIPPSKTTDNIMLTTQAERGIALMATAAALITGSIFTSIVTNDMSDIRRVRRQQGEADCQLSDFLETYQVSWKLERRLKDYLKQTVKRVTLPSKLEIASLLPELLHTELCGEAFGGIVACHQMFFSLMVKYPDFQYDLCVQGLSDWTLAPNETLFSPGLRCDNMLFVVYNFVLYKQKGMVTQTERSQPQTAKTWSVNRATTWATMSPITASQQVQRLVKSGKSHKSQTPVLRVTPGHWMCEGCLWTHWQYLGQAVAGSSTSLLCLSYQQLLSVTARHPDVSAELVIHARLFLSALDEIAEDELHDLSAVL